MRPHSITMVLGHGSDEVREWFADADDIRFVIQEPQLGTGHALLQAERVLTGGRARCCCCRGTCRCSRRPASSGSSPCAANTGASLVVATADLGRPFGLRPDGALARARSLRIVEERDATPAQRAIPRSTAASTRSPSTRSSTRLAVWAPATRRASTTCPIWSTSTARPAGSSLADQLDDAG